MSLDGAALRKLATLGLNSDQMAGVLDVLASMTDADDARKAAQRERTRKFREKIGAVTLQSHHRNGDTSRVGDARGEDNSLPQKIEPQESKKEQSSQARDLSEFRDELASLDTDRLDALIKHRRSKRAQLSGHAARLFIRDASACGLSLAEAADTCISRNWITIKPDWLGRTQVRGSPPSEARAPTQAQVFRLIAERAANGQDGDDRGRIRPALSDLRTG